MAAEDIFMGAGSGAASGAGVGSLFGNPLIGAGAGALIGGIGGFFRGRGRDKQKRAMAEARRRLAALQVQQRAQRMSDLDNAMSMFAPVDAEYERLYGGR